MVMKSFILFFLLLIQSQIHLNSQHLITHPIVKCSWNNFNTNEVDVLNVFLQNKKILVLSEIYHGDGTSYEAQCMILKRLIDSSAIDAIYTESSWLVIEKISSILKTEGKRGIPKTAAYMRSLELKYWLSNGFWDYLANKIIEDKISLIGFDVGASELIIDEMLNEIQSFKGIQEYKREHPYDYKLLMFEYKNFDGWGPSSFYTEKSFLRQQAFITQIKREYSNSNCKVEVKKWQAILDYFYWMYKRSSTVKKKQGLLNENNLEYQRRSFNSIRDSLMASHFLSIYKSRKSNEKSVCLVSSFHGIKKTNLRIDYQMPGENELKCMGEILDQQIGEDIYNMCFIRGGGKTGINYFSKGNIEIIGNPPINSLEFFLKSNTTAPYSIVDFEKTILSDSSFIMNATGRGYENFHWAKCFSGVFFIKNMLPLTFKNF